MKRERLREKGGQEKSDGGEKVRKRNYKKNWNEENKLSFFRELL